MDSTEGIVWITRLFLVVVGLLVVGMLAVPLLLIVKPVITEAFRARAAGDWWLPFLADSRGRFGPLAANHWWSVFRAAGRGGASGLLWRWGLWTVMALGVTGVCGYIAALVLRLLRSGWS